MSDPETPPSPPALETHEQWKRRFAAALAKAEEVVAARHNGHFTIEERNREMVPWVLAPENREPPNAMAIIKKHAGPLDLASTFQPSNAQLTLDLPEVEEGERDKNVTVAKNHRVRLRAMLGDDRQAKLVFDDKIFDEAKAANKVSHAYFGHKVFRKAPDKSIEQIMGWPPRKVAKPAEGQEPLGDPET